MPTSVESYANLGAVLVHLPPSAAPAIHVTNDPNNSGHIGGRNALAHTSALHQHRPAPSHGHPPNTGSPIHVVNLPPDGFIGGRNGGGGVESILNPHLPSVNTVHAFNRSHHTPPAHVHPPPAHVTNPSHLVITENTDTHIGGRSALAGSSLPAVQDQALSRTHNTLLPAVQDPAASLRALLPGIGAALQKSIPSGQRALEAIGIGTDPQTLGILIGLLRTQGFHVTMAFCDGSVRPGFSGPTAVLRAHGSTTVGHFLQQLSSLIGP